MLQVPATPWIKAKGFQDGIHTEFHVVVDHEVTVATEEQHIEIAGEPWSRHAFRGADRQKGAVLIVDMQGSDGGTFAGIAPERKIAEMAFHGDRGSRNRVRRESQALPNVPFDLLFEHAEFERVVSFLPEDLKDFARFAYYAGWRRNKRASLTWFHIEGNVLRLPPSISKTKDGRVLILEGALADIIERRRSVRRDDTPLVFHRTLQGSRYVRAGSGHPVKTFYKAWKTACRKAGTPVKRFFHDFRRTAVRNMTRTWVPRQTAKKISGHQTDEIFNRYDIVDEHDIRDAVRRTQRQLQRRTHQQHNDRPQGS